MNRISVSKWVLLLGLSTAMVVMVSFLVVGVGGQRSSGNDNHERTTDTGAGETELSKRSSKPAKTTAGARDTSFEGMRDYLFKEGFYGKPGNVARVDDGEHETIEQQYTPLELAAMSPITDNRALGRIIGVLHDRKQSDAVRNEAINLLRKSKYEGLCENLFRILDDANEGERFRRFCVQHLGIEMENANVQQREAIRAVLHSSISDRHAAVRREALLALVNAGVPGAEEIVLDWLTKKDDDGVRDIAIRCAYKLHLRDQIPLIRKYLYDANEVVRIAAIVTLSEWGDEDNRPAFEAAAKSMSVRLQRAGKAALERLDQQNEQDQ